MNNNVTIIIVIILTLIKASLKRIMETLKLLNDSSLDHLEYHHLKMSVLFLLRLPLLYVTPLFKGHGVMVTCNKFHLELL